MTGFYPLLLASVSGFANWLWILPVSGRIKKNWARLEKELESDGKEGEERKRAAEGERKRFMKWHGVSMLVNMAEFLGLVYYGVQLAEKLNF